MLIFLMIRSICQEGGNWTVPEFTCVEVNETPTSGVVIIKQIKPCNVISLERLPFTNHQINWIITRFLIKLSPNQIIYLSPNQRENHQIGLMLTNSLNLLLLNKIIEYQIELNSHFQPEIFYYPEIIKQRKENMILKHHLTAGLPPGLLPF